MREKAGAPVHLARGEPGGQEIGLRQMVPDALDRAGQQTREANRVRVEDRADVAQGVFLRVWQPRSRSASCRALLSFLRLSLATVFCVRRP